MRLATLHTAGHPQHEGTCSVARSVYFCSPNVHWYRLQMQIQQFRPIFNTCASSSAYVGLTPINLECHIVARTRKKGKWLLQLEQRCETRQNVALYMKKVLWRLS